MTARSITKKTHWVYPKWGIQKST